MKILAVDDDESILELIDHTLSISAHHEVTTVASAAQALEKIEKAEGKFECFLVDIQMPKVDGIDLTRSIRQIEGYERHPILMLTAMHEKSYLDMAFQAGATDYITKPFNFRDLRSRIFEAQKLTSENKQAPSETIAGQAVTWVRGELMHNDSEPLVDPGLGHVLKSYREFENYVQEAARCYVQDSAERRTRGPAVMGLKLADTAMVRKESPKEEVHSVLADLVQVVNKVFHTKLNSISYRGNGSFTCLLASHLNDSNGNIERELNAHLHSCFGDKYSSGLHVFVGNQVPVRTALPSAVLDILWMANENVEQRFVSKRDQFKFKSAS